MNTWDYDMFSKFGTMSDMMKSKMRKVLLIPLVLIIVIAFLFCPIKHAVKVDYIDEQYDIRNFEGQNIRLLCHYQQVTGSIWHAKYIEMDNGAFATLNPGTDISLSSRGFPKISGAYTSDRYGKTEIIVEGSIPAVFVGGDGAESFMKISKWDVVYPFDTGWFNRIGYLKDYLVLLDLILQ